VKRGDIYIVNLDPIKRHEESGQRPVVILSPEALNRRGFSLVAPITRGGGKARRDLTAIPLTGSGGETNGVALCGQIRTLDVAARRGRYVETLPDWLVADLIARVVDIYGLKNGL
jgi:mRNA interferase ChpB